jgi:hypothetical protein
MGSEQPTRPGRGLLYVLVGAVLFALIAVFLRNLDAFINAAGFYVDIYLAGAIVAVVGLIGAAFWLRGHQIYAKSKGQTALWGTLMGLLPVIGFIALTAQPAHTGAAGQEATGAPEGEGEARAAGAAPSEEEQEGP